MGMRIVGRSVRRVAGHLHCAGPLLNRGAAHADGRSHRVQRNCGSQELFQQCREQTVRRCDEYDTTVFTW